MFYSASHVYFKPPKALKEEAIAKLEAAKAKTDGKRYDKEIDRVIKAVEKSLDENYWTDETHLDPKYGHKVFDEEKRAVREMMNLINGKNTPQEVKEACQTAIENLVSADNLLARAGAGSPKVDRELEKAGAELAMENYDKAVDHYRNAWKHAQDA